MITVLLADDQELVRAGLRALAERDGDITVVGEAENGRDAVTRCSQLTPDVVLMDLSMPVMGGAEATRVIASDSKLDGTRVLVLTTFDDDDEVFAAIHAGASGYLLKDLSPDDLRTAIRTVASGDGILDPAITARVMRLVASERTKAAALPVVLTERESEVFELVGHGFSNEEIARTLFLSPATARTYVSRLLAKLQARDRAALIVLAYETGAVKPGRLTRPDRAATSAYPAVGVLSPSSESASAVAPASTLKDHRSRRSH